MREYYSRVLAYIACGASIAAGTYTQYFSYGILWMVPYAASTRTWRTTSASACQHDPRKVTRALARGRRRALWLGYGAARLSPWCPA